MGDPTMRKSVDDGFRGHIFNGNGRGPSGKAVHYRQQISKSVGWRHGDKIQVKMLETLLGDFEVANRWSNMPEDFGALTMLALPGPPRNVLSERWPDEFFGHRLSTSLYTWMTETVHEIKHAFSPRKWHKWSCGAIGNVDDELSLAHVNGA